MTDNDDHEEDTSLQAGPSSGITTKSLKRTASKAALNPPTSPSSRLLTTPKKRPYTGPINDPNPINPFAASPLRRSALKSDSTMARATSSPFLHASSPSKLKHLLQENSLRKVQQRTLSPPKEITPRTKARKRLTGEMDETPVKTRVRRKRGEGREKSERETTEKVDELFPGITRATSPALEDDDELGPTPVKPVAGFHEFFDTEGSSSKANFSTNGQSNSLMTRLLSAGAKGKQRSTETVGLEEPTKGNGSRTASRGDASETSQSSLHPVDQAGQDDQPTPAPSETDQGEWDPAARIVETTRSRPAVRRDKIVSISDDEIDEWDPEANHIRHRVKIVPTRPRPKKGDWSDDDDDLDDELENSGADQSPDVDRVDTHTPALDDTNTYQINPSIPSPPPAMSLLSLTSPNHRQGRYAKLKELRYKALFNPTGSDAQRLKAFQKGQEAFQSGETEENDEEDDLHALEQGDDERGEIADDDWESESEGWKRTGVEMDNDAW